MYPHYGQRRDIQLEDIQRAALDCALDQWDQCVRDTQLGYRGDISCIEGYHHPH